jgi:6-phosphogluconolactonase
MTRDVRVFADADELALRAAQATADLLDEAVRASGSCSLVLSGGTTPRRLYTLLATRFRDRIPWNVLHLFLADERYVPYHDPRSNYGMIAATLVDHVPCPPDNVHPMPTDFSNPEDAARDYEATLRRHFEGSTSHFDLAVLGLGADGHTASLFPGSAALEEQTRWVVTASAPVDPPLRLTLTLPALAGATRAFFIVTGSDKADALRDVLAPAPDWRVYPAAAVVSPGIWWVDREAAADLNT